MPRAWMCVSVCVCFAFAFLFVFSLRNFQCLNGCWLGRWVMKRHTHTHTGTHTSTCLLISVCVSDCCRFFLFSSSFEICRCALLGFHYQKEKKCEWKEKLPYNMDTGFKQRHASFIKMLCAAEWGRDRERDGNSGASFVIRRLMLFQYTRYRCCACTKQMNDDEIKPKRSTLADERARARPQDQTWQANGMCAQCAHIVKSEAAVTVGGFVGSWKSLHTERIKQNNNNNNRKYPLVNAPDD